MGTSGSEGGPRKPTSHKAGRAPRSDPYTHVGTAPGTVYVAVVLDVYSRMIVGWQASSRMRTSLVLDALELALWCRSRDRQDPDGLIHHSDAGSQTGFKGSSQQCLVGVTVAAR